MLKKKHIEENNSLIVGTKIESNTSTVQLQAESKKRTEIGIWATRLKHSHKAGVSKAVTRLLPHTAFRQTDYLPISRL